jgi:hypothetical protein
MNTFKNTQYTITTSLSDQSSSIYIQIANNISYATYEGTFEKSAFRLSFELAGIYRIINKCFAAFTDGGESSYKVAIEIEPNKMRLQFHCMLEGIITVEFEIRLQEKTVTPDSIMSAEFEKQKQLVEMLRGQVAKLSTEFAELKKEKQTLKTQIKKQATELAELKNNGHDELTEVFIDEVLYYTNKSGQWFNSKLQELMVDPTKQFDMCAELSKLTKKVKEMEQSERLLQHKFDTQQQLIEHLGFAEIEMTYGSTVASRGAPAVMTHFPINTTSLLLDGSRMNSITNHILQKIKYFYRLELLVLRGCANRQDFDPNHCLSGTFTKLILVDSTYSGFHDMTFLSELPNVKELTMIHCIINPNAVSNLRSIKHNVKTFAFRLLTDRASFNTFEMEVYCKQNNIALHYLPE